MRMTRLDLPDADVHFAPDWLDADASHVLLRALIDTVPWSVHHIHMFGRLVASPRLSAWIGDPDARYRYSGTTFDPLAWPAALVPVREQLQRDCGVAFNSVLVNRYRDGRDAMGWHRDDEPELGPAPVIASVSLGATRRFVLRRVARGAASAGALKHAIDLTPGSLLVMAGPTQRHWQHALPRTAKDVVERINLTFRLVRPNAKSWNPNSSGTTRREPSLSSELSAIFGSASQQHVRVSPGHSRASRHAPVLTRSAHDPRR